MLEVRNLCKTYVTSGNVTTKALDRVSVKFPETGMVFLLGKSGSGKSTLLNVTGGLDAPDSGEIIVKGRSSSTFSGGDFDSYRNTFIGFIFQEYNVLDEFTVEDNIALALELQGKPKDIAKIEEILASVDMQGFAKRKPNTLSGGQKQRIAIARALVKDPQIIMADEPTGALDSDTGKQVFETLRKLSKNKLVIVVSHDRDFAEEYGDRIIELKDGKILSDTTKSFTASDTVGNLRKIDNHTLSIPKGTALSREDIAYLTAFLQSSEEEIIISNDKDHVAGYKKEVGISSEGAKAGFSPTNEKEIVSKSYTPEDCKLIRSKLPLRHAFRMGLSNLKLKPVRLFFAIFLSVISFVLLGVVSTMMFYDKEAVSVESLTAADPDYLGLKKYYSYSYQDYNYTQDAPTNFSDSDIAKLKQQFGDDLIAWYTFDSNPPLGNHNYGSTISVNNIKNYQKNGYVGYLTGFAHVDSDHPLLHNLKGTYPQNPGEIAISSYTWQCLQTLELYDMESGNEYSLEKPEDILGKTICFSSRMPKEFTVTGIYDVDGTIPSQYQNALNGADQNLQWEWFEHLSNNIYALGLVSEDFYESNRAVFGGGFSSTYLNIAICVEDIYGYGFSSTYSDVFIAHEGMSVITPTGDRYTGDFTGKKAVLPFHMFASMFYAEMDGKHEEAEMALSELAKDGYNYRQLLEIVRYGNWNEQYFTEEQRMEYWKLILPKYQEYNLFPKDFSQAKLRNDNGEELDIEIIGFVLSDIYTIGVTQAIVDEYGQGDKIVTDYQWDASALWSGAIIPTEGLKIADLVSYAAVVNQDSSTVHIQHPVAEQVEMVNQFVEMMTKIFLVAGIVLALFATLLLFNFITVSISNKTKEIGILRAVGARGTDVFKIFFAESFVIVLICLVIAIAGSIGVCGIINGEMSAGIGGITLLVFGWKSLLLMIAISAFVAFFSTYLPVSRIARKKPVESIRSL